MSREVQPCGTRAAYLRHRRNGEAPCAEFSAANSRYTTAHMKEQRAQKRSGQFSRGGSLPISAPEDAHKAPCTDPRNGYIWDPRGEWEPDAEVLDRWRAASLLCITTCPVFSHCAESKAMAGGSGVWAGRIPGRVS
mgnify:CR=1 FL=1